MCSAGCLTLTLTVVSFEQTIFISHLNMETRKPEKHWPNLWVGMPMWML